MTGRGMPRAKLPALLKTASAGLEELAKIAAAHGGTAEAAANRPSGLRIVLTVPAADSARVQPGAGAALGPCGVPVALASGRDA